MRIHNLLAGAALAFTVIAGSAGAATIYQSIPDLTVNPILNGYCSQCEANGQDIGQAFSIGTASTAKSASFAVASNYNWPTTVDLSIFANAGGVLGANLFSQSYSSFVSEVDTGFNTHVLTVNLGAGVALAAGNYYLFLTNPNSLAIPAYSGGSNDLVYLQGAGSPPTVGSTVNTYTSDIAVSISDTAAGVPEPTTWALMLTGFLGAGVALRSNRRRTVAATV